MLVSPAREEEEEEEEEEERLRAKTEDDGNIEGEPKIGNLVNVPPVTLTVVAEAAFAFAFAFATVSAAATSAFTMASGPTRTYVAIPLVRPFQ